MENFIKKIIKKKVDDKVHKSFIRYSLGDYPREIFYVKISKKIKVSAGYEYLIVFHEFLAKHICKGEVILNGVIESIKDLTDGLNELGIEYTAKRRFGKPGNKYEIKKFPTTANVYLKLVERFYSDFLMFKVKNDNCELKLKKTTAPRAGTLTEKFVTIQFNPEFFPLFKDEFLFDIDKDFKTAEIKHTYIIKKIDADEKLLKKDASRARKEAIRSGKIQRVIILDGKEFSNYEFNFKA